MSGGTGTNAAKSFLCSALKNTCVRTKITLDAYAASHRAVREMKKTANLRVASRFDPASTGKIWWSRTIGE